MAPNRMRKQGKMARVLFIVDRDHPELLASLRQEFAAQEAAGSAAIFSDRRQGPGRPSFEPRAFDEHRRDRQRNSEVSRDLQGLGCAVVPRSEATSATA
jgi:hypothetical protein